MDYNRGLIIVEPYGDYIVDYSKTIIVKSKNFSTITNNKMLLIQNKLGIAIIILDSPYELTINQFNKLYKKHKINSKDRLDWWPSYKILYAYNILFLQVFPKPILLDYPQGPQVAVLSQNIIYKKVFVGTSGFLDYTTKNRINSIEINYTFYKFPSITFVNKLKSYDIVYSVKVNRAITHYKQLLDVANLWKKFYNLFEPIHDKIKCFLFQFSPHFLPTDNSINKIKKFAKLLNHKHNYVFEFRHPDWNNHIALLNKLNIIFCSSDYLYPLFRTMHFNILKNKCYIRLHGPNRDNNNQIMYKGRYNVNDLKKIYDFINYNKIYETYLYFNNTDSSNDATVNSEQFVKKLNKINM
jgi:uncharacterized protein YecE (DUF72 family)